MEDLSNLYSFFSCFIAFLAFVFSIITYIGQKKVNKLQMLESTLFNMIELHLSIKNALNFVGQQPTKSPLDNDCQFVNRKVHGCDVFKFCWSECWFKDKYVHEDNRAKINLDYKRGKRGMVNILVSLGSKAYRDYRELDIFKVYFTHLYEMIRFLDTRDFLKARQKKEYVEQIRAILSPYELIWIFYECLFGESNDKLKPLVEKYTLLKYIPRNSLAITKDIMDSAIFKKDRLINDYEYYVSNLKGCKDKFYKSAFED